MNDPSTNNVMDSIPPVSIKDPELKYICGDCGIVNYLSARDPIRCRSCGYRIMYKARTQRCKDLIILCEKKRNIVYVLVVQFECR